MTSGLYVCTSDALRKLLQAGRGGLGLEERGGLGGVGIGTSGLEENLGGGGTRDTGKGLC
jgi:hypothetical protein